MRKIYFLPLIVFALAMVAFFVGLGINPSQIPSARLGKAMPEFTAPPLYEGAAQLSDQDFNSGQATLLNVFAEWCVPCRTEHPILMALQARGVAIRGLNYKDQPDAAQRFLAELGNPYDLIGQDQSGRIGIDFGISGVPETFVISGNGQILYQHIGPLTREAVVDKILPLLEGDN